MSDSDDEYDDNDQIFNSIISISHPEMIYTPYEYQYDSTKKEALLMTDEGEEILSDPDNGSDDIPLSPSKDNPLGLLIKKLHPFPRIQGRTKTSENFKSKEDFPIGTTRSGKIIRNHPSETILMTGEDEIGQGAVGGLPTNNEEQLHREEIVDDQEQTRQERQHNQETELDAQTRAKNEAFKQEEEVLHLENQLIRARQEASKARENAIKKGVSKEMFTTHQNFTGANAKTKTHGPTVKIKTKGNTPETGTNIDLNNLLSSQIPIKNPHETLPSYQRDKTPLPTNNTGPPLPSLNAPPPTAIKDIVSAIMDYQQRSPLPKQDQPMTRAPNPTVPNLNLSSLEFLNPLVFSLWLQEIHDYQSITRCSDSHLLGELRNNPKILPPNLRQKLRTCWDLASAWDELGENFPEKSDYKQYLVEALKGKGFLPNTDATTKLNRINELLMIIKLTQRFYPQVELDLAVLILAIGSISYPTEEKITAEKAYKIFSKQERKEETGISQLLRLLKDEKKFLLLHGQAAEILPKNFAAHQKNQDILTHFTTETTKKPEFINRQIPSNSIKTVYLTDQEITPHNNTITDNNTNTILYSKSQPTSQYSPSAKEAYQQILTTKTITPTSQKTDCKICSKNDHQTFSCPAVKTIREGKQSLPESICPIHLSEKQSPCLKGKCEGILRTPLGHLYSVTCIEHVSPLRHRRLCRKTINGKMCGQAYEDTLAEISKKNKNRKKNQSLEANFFTKEKSMESEESTNSENTGLDLPSFIDLSDDNIEQIFEITSTTANRCSITSVMFEQELGTAIDTYGKNQPIVIIYDCGSSTTLVDMKGISLNHHSEQQLSAPTTLITVQGAVGTNQQYPLALLKIVLKDKDKATTSVGKIEAMMQEFPQPHVSSCPEDIIGYFKDNKKTISSIPQHIDTSNLPRILIGLRDIIYHPQQINVPPKLASDYPFIRIYISKITGKYLVGGTTSTEGTNLSPTAKHFLLNSNLQ